ncbi:MAG: RNA polymerase sigma-70 factor [Cyclobacteriaceae bacterium]
MAPYLYDDLLLVNLLKQDNELAFQKIYNSYWDKLFAYTYNRLHIRETSEEVVQDVFFSLWAKRESIMITSSLSAYLYGATKHRLLNELRSVKVRKAYASDYSSFIKNLYDNSNVEQQDLNDLEHSIEARVSELPKQCQAVFRLSRQEYIPNHSIAERLNISTKTVENYLTQALKYIRTSLGGFLVFLIILVPGTNILP